MKFATTKSIARRSFIAIVLLISVVFSGCAGKPKVVSTPQVLIQELSTDGQARVVLHNFSNVPMTFSQLRYTLSFQGKLAAEGNETLSIEVPPNSPEQISIKLTISEQSRLLLSARQPIAYTLKGMIISSKPSRKSEYIYEGRLNPVPGKPGSWR
jgi:LEA14-like dessication related protein